MTNNFKASMSKKTDAELIKITSIQRHDYQPEAVEAAEAEIQLRELDTTKIDEINQEIRVKQIEQKQVDSKKVNSGLRFVHMLIDTACYCVVGYIIILFVSPLYYFYNSFNTMMIETFIYAISTIFYYIFMETYYQRTIGQFVTGSKVIMKSGEKPTLQNIILRTFCRFIPFDNLSFLFSNNGIHDSLSNTTVIKAEKVT